MKDYQAFTVADIGVKYRRKNEAYTVLSLNEKNLPPINLKCPPEVFRAIMLSGKTMSNVLK